MPGGSRTENCVSIYMYGCQPLSVVFDMTIPAGLFRLQASCYLCTHKVTTNATYI